jgi:hypothetical protein
VQKDIPKLLIDGVEGSCEANPDNSSNDGGHCQRTLGYLGRY